MAEGLSSRTLWSCGAECEGVFVKDLKVENDEVFAGAAVGLSRG